MILLWIFLIAVYEVFVFIFWRRVIWEGRPYNMPLRHWLWAFLFGWLVMPLALLLMLTVYLWESALDDFLSIWKKRMH